MKQNIVIASVANTPKQIVIQTNTGECYKNGEPKLNKYKIWINDQNGQPSLAYTQYQKLRPLAGDQFDVEVFEKEASFTNQQGKLINYTDRTINFFYTDGDGNPVAPQAQNSLVGSITPQTAPISHQQPNQSPQPNLDTRFVELERRIAQGFHKRDMAIEELATKVIEMTDKVNYLTEIFKLNNPDAWKIHGDIIEKPNNEIDMQDIQDIVSGDEKRDKIKL